MKKILFGLAISVATAVACNSNTTSEKNNKADSASSNSSIKETGNTIAPDAKVGSMKKMVTQYLQIKNALANDNGKDAANAGNAFVESMSKLDKNLLTVEKKKKWDDLADDAKEMAEHIGKNAGDVEHQREHFDMLSDDMYDMVKTFGTGQMLYKDFCPMYNKNNGAIWLSEQKK